MHRRQMRHRQANAGCLLFSLFLAAHMVSAEIVQFLETLEPSKRCISPDTCDEIIFSAKLDRTARWELTLTGEVSGKRDTVSGEDSQICVHWKGMGWTSLERIDVVLEIVDPQSATDKLFSTASIEVCNASDSNSDSGAININQESLRRHKPFEITQTEQGLLIKADLNFTPRLEIYDLKGAPIQTYQPISDRRSKGLFFVPITHEKLPPDNYIALLCGEAGNPSMMVRKFTWR